MEPLRTKNLAPGVDRYLFVEHTVDGTSGYRSHPYDQRTFLVLAGTVELAYAGGGRRYGVGEGWHAPAGTGYRIGAGGPAPAVLIEAGTVHGGTVPAEPGTGDFPDLSGHRVDKPWGYEIWYTHNLSDPGYVLKRIHMAAGRQSSLQSHRYRAETNYVIEGEATVLSGLRAPRTPTATVDPSRLTVTVQRPGTGWTSPPNELHRVVARTEYTAVEVSTPELDDVVRWPDGAGRVATR